MKRFSAQFVITNTGPALKRAIITTDDDGNITAVEDTGGELREQHSLEFYNGIIIPGFVNSHCHLELSHMKGIVTRGQGLSSFIESIRNTRSADAESITEAAGSADRDMYASGVNLCADICNTSLTFSLKKKSRIEYLNLLEVFGIDRDKAGRRFDEISAVAERARELNLPFSLVPHSVYSLSLTLFRMLKERSEDNPVTSIHFMETAAEAELVERHSGPLMDSYTRSGLISSGFETATSHSDAILNEITESGNLILVHNTFANKEIIRRVKKRDRLYWCLCPDSNMYIENKLPPVDMLIDEGCEITIGTDSLASNSRLDIFEEMKTLQLHFPALTAEELVGWATLNGAKALGREENYGTIAPGKRPGLLLIRNADLRNMKLLPGSSITRLI